MTLLNKEAIVSIRTYGFRKREGFIYKEEKSGFFTGTIRRGYIIDVV